MGQRVGWEPRHDCFYGGVISYSTPGLTLPCFSVAVRKNWKGGMCLRGIQASSRFHWFVTRLFIGFSRWELEKSEEILDLNNLYRSHTRTSHLRENGVGFCVRTSFVFRVSFWMFLMISPLVMQKVIRSCPSQIFWQFPLTEYRMKLCLTADIALNSHASHKYSRSKWKRRRKGGITFIIVIKRKKFICSLFHTWSSFKKN